jgi:hypothetical protein
MLYLRERAPRVHKGAEHEMVFDAGRIEGYTHAINAISEVIGVEDAKIENFDS